ncbi:MAG: long-chain fatty acid--CoA ligase [Anaerolineales bacterium]|nr:long-chain fatty acid--CoA ligase [Anaerolineales bacterium]
MSFSYADKPWLKNYDEGVLPAIDIPEHTVHHFLEESARTYPEQTAVLFKGTPISYRELNAQADAIAASLLAKGLQKGDCVALYMVNCPQFMIAFFGILKAGGVVMALNPLYTERELTHQLADCGAKTVIVMSLYYEMLKKVQRAGATAVTQIIVTNIKEYLPWHLKILFTLAKERKDGHAVHLVDGDTKFKDFLARGRGKAAPNVDVGPNDIALLQYTGGTTGVSKGAIGLHKNLLGNAYMVRAWDPNMRSGSEVFLASLPLFHSYGIVAAMITPISLGAKIVLIADPRDQDDVMKSINTQRPTIFPGVPAMYVAINNNPDVAAGKYDIRSINTCLSASAPLLVETKRRFEELTGGNLVEAYGLTEAHVATHANPLYSENPPGSIGLPLPNVEVRLVALDDQQKEVPVGAVGEIVIKGPTIMPGYWNMPEETAVAVRDGWLYTGDMARMDEDGYFFIEDRKKDMIIAGGFNIYPREVEEVLAQHPAVQEVGVAGVPDAKRGETVVAWVVKRPGDATTESEMIEWSKTQLARYKYPRKIVFVDELPKSSVGKTLRRELVSEYVAKGDLESNE